MKIEKRKVTGSPRLSTATKSTFAALLGMAAAFTLNACDDSTSAKDDNEEPDGTVTPGSSDSSTPATPSSSNAEGAQTPTSSSALDIPLSQEHLSSEVQDALSSIAESSSSATEPSSSDDAVPESSAAENPESSGDSTITSSESAPESSESAPPSSSDEVQPPNSSDSNENQCEPNDPACYEVHLCTDPNDWRCMTVSMVTTFERDDITG